MRTGIIIDGKTFADYWQIQSLFGRKDKIESSLILILVIAKESEHLLVSEKISMENEI